MCRSAKRNPRPQICLAALEDIIETNKIMFLAKARKNASRRRPDRDAVCLPDYGGGDVSGSVILLLMKRLIPSQADVKLVMVAASFLGKQMEDF
jgi:hypothetical protein